VRQVLVPFGVWLCLLVAASHAGAAGRTAWTHRDKLYDVAIVGAEAWIVGHPGVILHSADGGRTWAAQSAGTDEPLFAVDFVDAKTGWVVGRQGLLLRTTDGGATWLRSETGTPEPLLGLDFADARHGTAVGNFATILRTADGGQTWTRQVLDAGDPEADTVLNAVAFVSPDEGWVVGEFGTIAHTTNGGAEWQLQDSGVDRALFGVAFRDAQRGVAVGSAGAVVRTADGGASWEMVLGQEAADGQATAKLPNLLTVWYTPDRLWACGLYGMCVKETEQGLVPLRPASYLWLAGLAFGGDGVLGIAVGRAGTIMTTTDGGVSWAVLPTVR
jgi:photosystem II stability/assembly factor-like uncharacterized protein